MSPEANGKLRNWELYLESVRTLEERRENKAALFGRIFAISSAAIVLILGLSPNGSSGYITLVLSIISAIHCLCWSKCLGEFNALIKQKYDAIFELEEDLDIRLCTDERDLRKKYERITILGSGDLTRLLCFLVVLLEIAFSLLRIFKII